jgi:hypothetical protein
VSRGVAAVFLTAHGHGIELPPSLRHLQVIAKPFTSTMLAEALLMALKAVDEPGYEGISCVCATG